MSRKPYEVDEDKIDLREIFRTISCYKISILLITVAVTFFSVMFAYFKPNIYSTVSTVEVGKENHSCGYGGEDILSMPISTDAEICLIKSFYLINQALSNIDFARHYYKTVSFKEYELYKDSPYDVNLMRGYNISFIIHPYSASQYHVDAKGKDKKSGKKWKYSHVYSYGEMITSKFFSFRLNTKKGKSLDNASYRFVVMDKESAVGVVRKEVSVALSNKMSTVLDITVEDSVALRSREFNNALAEAYIYRKTREASKLLSFINAQLKQINWEYLLFENSYFSKVLNSEETAFDIKAKGYKALLTHPERYRYISDPRIEFGRIKELEVYFQIDINSLGGFYSRETKEFALLLNEWGMVDYVGSDVHRTKQVHYLKKVFGDQEYYSMLLQNNSILKDTLLQKG